MRTDDDEIREQLEAMHASAPGKSKISIKHLRQLVRTDERVLQAITKVANAILLWEEGCDDPRLLKLTEARGVGLVKDETSGKLRTIVVNEAILNVVARIALKKLRGSILDALHEDDYGFSRAGGTENISQTLNALLHFHQQRNMPFVLLQLDFENAFNSTFRQAIFDSIWRKCPGFLPFARFRYGYLKILFRDSR